jgi:hypothetical protein
MKINFTIKALLLLMPIYGLYLLGINTYWPIGNAERHLNNFDSLVHGSMIWLPSFCVVRFLSKRQERQESDELDRLAETPIRIKEG